MKPLREGTSHSCEELVKRNLLFPTPLLGADEQIAHVHLLQAYQQWYALLTAIARGVEAERP